MRLKQLRVKTLQRIINILDFIEAGEGCDYDEFDAYSDICNIISEYQQEVINILKDEVKK